MVRRVCNVLAAMFGLAAVASAQRVVSSLDVSGAGVWYADTIRSVGASLSPAIRIDWNRATLGAAVSLAQLGGGSTSVQGSVAPSVFTPSIGPFTPELAASVGGSTHEDGTRTGQAIGVVRAHVMGVRSGVWMGGGVGRTWDGTVWRDVRQAEAGGWTEWSDATALASVSPVAVGDGAHYTDFQMALRYPVARVEMGFTAGARTGTVGESVGGSSRAWGSVSVTAWAAPRLALVGSAGTYPVDLTQGYPGGRFVSFALRIASPERRGATGGEHDSSRDGGESPETSHAPSVREFDVRRVDAARRTVRVNAPFARQVEVSADFTHWRPVRLARGADGWWSVTLPIAPGTYQLNLRVDGGAWTVPPGLLAKRDEFGGTVGILHIE